MIRTGSATPPELAERWLNTDAETRQRRRRQRAARLVSIKSLPLIRVSVYGMLRGVGEESLITGEERREMSYNGRGGGRGSALGVL